MRSAVFLDRDGTLIKDYGYMKSPSQVELLPNTIECLHSLKNFGLLFVMATNQSGIGRGYLSVDDFNAVQYKLFELLAAHDIFFDGVYYCPHMPSDMCKCRKPRTGMALSAHRDLGINFSESYMVGDKDDDIRFGYNFGAKASFNTLKDLCMYLKMQERGFAVGST